MFPSVSIGSRRRLACVVALAAGVFAPRVAHADEVVRWNRLAALAVSRAALDARAESRVFAVLHTAVHDAVVAAQRRGEPYCASTLDGAGASPEAAAASAAHVVLSTFVPAARPALDAALADSLAALPEDRARDLGVASGRQAADLVMAARAWSGGCGHVNGRAIANTLSEVVELFSHGCNADHIAVNGSPAIRPKESRSQEWNRRARKLVASRALSLSDTARLFAVVNLALLDSPTDGL